MYVVIVIQTTIDGTLKFAGTHHPNDVVVGNKDPVVGTFETQGQPTILYSHKLAPTISFKHCEKLPSQHLKISKWSGINLSVNRLVLSPNASPS